MSDSHPNSVPPFLPPNADPGSTWDPLGPGAQSAGQATWSAQPHLSQPGYPPGGYPQPAWVPPVPVYPYAVWIRRVGAYLIDFAPAYLAMIPFYIGYTMLYVRLLRASMSGSADPGQLVAGFGGTALILMGVGGALMLVAFGWQWYNRWLIAGRTGQSMGKRVLRTKLVAEVNGQPIGPVNAFLRDLLHVLDGIADIGFLWPLWDAKRQTFADMIMQTVVVDLRVRPATSDASHGPTQERSP